MGLKDTRSEMYELVPTSTVVILIPAGFHLGRFHPSTHMAPRLNRLTVPSPSPIFTPFRIWWKCQIRALKYVYRICVTFGLTESSVYSESMKLVLDKGIPSLGVLHSFFWVSTQTGCAASPKLSSNAFGPRVYLRSQISANNYANVRYSARQTNKSACE